MHIFMLNFKDKAQFPELSFSRDLCKSVLSPQKLKRNHSCHSGILFYMYVYCRTSLTSQLLLCPDREHSMIPGPKSKLNQDRRKDRQYP